MSKYIRSVRSLRWLLQRVVEACLSACVLPVSALEWVPVEASVAADNQGPVIPWQAEASAEPQWSMANHGNSRRGAVVADGGWYSWYDHRS